MATARRSTATQDAARIKSLEIQLASLRVERDFWVEQARTLQNHLQTVMRGQAAMMEQLATTAVSEDDVKDHCQRIALELRQPLTTVEATMALASAARDGTQGAYTPVSAGNRKELKW